MVGLLRERSSEGFVVIRESFSFCDPPQGVSTEDRNVKGPTFFLHRFSRCLGDAGGNLARVWIRLRPIPAGSNRTGWESDHSRRFFASVVLGLPAPSRYFRIMLLDDVMRTRGCGREDDVMFLIEEVTSCL